MTSILKNLIIVCMPFYCYSYLVGASESYCQPEQIWGESEQVSQPMWGYFISALNGPKFDWHEQNRKYSRKYLQDLLERSKRQSKLSIKQGFRWPNDATKELFSILYEYGELATRGIKYPTSSIDFKNKLWDLIFHKAFVNARDDIGWTPVMYAAKYGCIPALEVLRDFDADLSLCDQDEWNALHIAVYHGHARTLGFLLCSENYFSMDKHDALRLKNKTGESPWRLAYNAGFYTLADMLYNVIVYYQG